MAIAKVILNGETLMDVTSDTVTASNTLSGIKATKNDGTKITGNIASKSSTDLTVSGATVTAPAGYYANAASKAVATTTHSNPTATIASSTGVVTASHTQGTGYVTSGTTTGTLSLTTQAGKTITPTESAQTAVASYRWTTGPVNVAAISSTYVGTGVTTRSAADLTASGSNVTAPAGYYSSGVSKSVGAGEAFTPAVTITKAPTITLTASTGVVTATYNGSSSITPTVTSGYVSAGTAGTVSTTGTSTYQLTMRSAADMTVAGQSVTAPAGYYSQAFTKAVTTTTHPNPTAAIVSSTGVVTATHTQGTGYVTGGTTTGTLNLTTKGATTYNTSTADQTIASNRWLTGTQTIKGVTTSNLTAANIAEGVVVKVGDANNASRITQITGTHSGATSYTATISGSGNSSYCYVTHNGTKYYTDGNTFSFKAGDTLTIYCRGNYFELNGEQISLTNYSYTYTLPIGDVNIAIEFESSTSNDIGIWTYVAPTEDLTISSAGYKNVYSYAGVIVPAGSAFPPATTITKAPTFSMNSATGVITASYTGSSSVTPTITSGWISKGTAGTISTTGTSTYQLTSKAAATYYPSTADQTISSQRWLVGDQTIKSVVTSNLIAENVAKGVVVEIGDSSNASRIAQITGTHSGAEEYTNIYKTIATGGLIKASGTTSYSAEEIANYCNSFSIIDTRQFLGVYMSGTFTFSNVIRIDGTAFAWPQAWGANNPGMASYYFPSVSYIGLYAFTYNSGIYTIEAPLATVISNYAFSDCRQLSNISFPKCTTIGSCAFYNCDKISSAIFPLVTSIMESTFCGCSSLVTADCPACTKIAAYAFQSCKSLTTISFPVCTSIGIRAFYSCHSLSEAIFPSCTSIGISAFQSCHSLTTVSFPVCVNINAYAFQNCSSLSEASFPACTSIGAYAFWNCPSLSVASFPACTDIAVSVFYSCSALTTINFPACTNIGSNAFWNCYSLSVASFPACASIAGYAFNNCSTLLSLYLLGSSIPYLAGSTAFTSTPIAGHTTYTSGTYGSIFVPASLYNSYITATNWSRFSSRFVSV